MYPVDYQLKNSDSKICCYPNPSIETLPILKETYGVNMLITSIKHLSEIYYTKIKCKENNIHYINVLFNDDLHSSSNIKNIVSQIKTIFDLLQNNRIHLVLSSASGVFDVTVVAYCLLRMSGENRQDALRILTDLMFEKKIRLGELRYEFCENKLVPRLIDDEIIRV